MSVSLLFQTNDLVHQIRETKLRTINNHDSTTPLDVCQISDPEAEVLKGVQFLDYDFMSPSKNDQ